VTAAQISLAEGSRPLDPRELSVAEAAQ